MLVNSPSDKIFRPDLLDEFGIMKLRILKLLATSEFDWKVGVIMSLIGLF